MKISYYPGCTLKTKAKNLEASALACLDLLGVEYEELPRWNCCGAVYSLSDDDLIHLIAPVRDLIRVQEQGFDTVLTLCSMCYNTLARANDLMKNDEVKRGTINDFMDEEPDYKGEVKVVHFLDFIRDEIGWDKLKNSLKNPLEGMKLAPYYGCTLLRPENVSIDKSNSPVVFEECMEALGAEIVKFPGAVECCGSYQVLGNPEAALKVSHNIISDAVAHGAEAMVLTCPLCDYNLGHRQEEMLKKYDDAGALPIFYFTQLMAVALGADPKLCYLELNQNISREYLKGKNLLEEVSA
ncbi:MAG: heterodisulfide reductase, subunit B [Candidatus Zixiibacteriota bacterium]|nr:MAG: heterodisulfide reductase, subunit B [candidate division Zixibacteria bacterium]